MILRENIEGGGGAYVCEEHVSRECVRICAYSNQANIYVEHRVFHIANGSIHAAQSTAHTAVKHIP